MREIKFRAWNGKTMYYDVYIRDNEVLRHYNDVNRTDTLIWVHGKSGLKTVFDAGWYMQYTGLKDKNGKEIYEGDIIKWICIGKEGGNEEDIGEKRDMGNRPVIFENGKFTLTKPSIPVGHLDKDEIEIIGNIHKNPELLREQTGK